MNAINPECPHFGRHQMTSLVLSLNVVLGLRWTWDNPHNHLLIAILPSGPEHQIIMKFDASFCPSGVQSHSYFMWCFSSLFSNTTIPIAHLSRWSAVRCPCLKKTSGAIMLLAMSGCLAVVPLCLHTKPYPYLGQFYVSPVFSTTFLHPRPMGTISRCVMKLPWGPVSPMT